MIPRRTTTELEVPDRLFQITHVSRTHTQVWLQSDASENHKHRLEVLFQDVRYLCMPFVLRGLWLAKAEPEHAARLLDQHELDADPAWDVYRVSRTQDWFVVSASPLWAESKLGYRDEPVFWSQTGREDVVVSLGTVE
ncbi:hypothetical protein ACH495_17575 [Micromonospora sp. NPDC018662]|uniref:hypothetical protein n=1 Tax=Micromonospora sp. NPDC018662 TaxID=3364238 RepID=UPI00379DF7DC